ncbi:hypothetical protein QUB10_27405 [Microcoleus sp. B5-D4]|uniref:hypothetical protein n=1 Tax=unclassified Microcoleus TaxID=2642155 RepID=UPI002FD0B3B7
MKEFVLPLLADLRLLRRSIELLEMPTTPRQPYTQSIAQECNTDMLWASRWARAFYQFTGSAYRAGVKLPMTTQLMSKILCGEPRYADIANRAFQKLMPL